MTNKLTELRSSLKTMLVPTLNRPSKKTSIHPFPQGDSIPKIIHQTFHSSQLPEELQKNVSHLKNINPGWEYRFYDDNDIRNFIASNYPPFVLDLFKKIDDSYGAAKADLFRYLLMYKCGGLYLDIKSSASRPLDEVFQPQDRYLLSHWKNGKGEKYEGWGQHEELGKSGKGEFEQWYIACAPGHPFLKSVIEFVLRNIKIYNPILHGVGKHGVLRVTGPVAYTLAIKDVLPSAFYRITDSQDELGLEYSLYRDKAHTKIFKNHYTFLTVPVVEPGNAKTGSAGVLRLLQKTKRLFSKRFLFS